MVSSYANKNYPLYDISLTTVWLIFIPMCTQVNDGEPYVMWVSGLHIPQSYLTALVQATCRKNQWPLDKSTLYTSVTEVC